MKTNHNKIIYGIAIMTTILLTAGGFADAKADEVKIDRYEFDFKYQGIQYQILSEEDQTVAIAQNYDIDYNGPLQAPPMVPTPSQTGDNGFLMSTGFFGPFVVIPTTVYDDNGKAYTVTEIADQAIDYVWMATLVLPETLTSINGGIVDLPYLSTLYLPSGLKEIDGIIACRYLSSVYIPNEVETIKEISFSKCGLKQICLPPSVKTLEDRVLQHCDSLYSALLSGVEKMGKDCFRGCNIFNWANLPESLKEMGDGCFNDCAELTRISLPWSEIKMNDCFNGCPSVIVIETLAQEPYPFPENCFNDVDRSKCDLLVPQESLDKYMEADGWNEFYRINGVPTGKNGVQTAKADNRFIALGGRGVIDIINMEGERIDITAASGERAATVNASGSSQIALPAGIYIVSSESGSTKVKVM